MKNTSALKLMLVTAVLAGISSAQLATGAPPFASMGGGPFDTVNLGSLNAYMVFPVLHKAGRGTDFDYHLSYDSSVWYPVERREAKTGSWSLQHHYRDGKAWRLQVNRTSAIRCRIPRGNATTDPVTTTGRSGVTADSIMSTRRRVLCITFLPVGHT